MINYENFFAFDYWQYEVIRHLFSFTAAVFAASLVYFAMSARSVLPRYRNTAYISAVVMVSAFLEIGALWVMWNGAFAYDAATGTMLLQDGRVFANGYRYANWLIDVPMLLTQFLVVLGFAGAVFWSRWRKLTIAGALMIITGYIGQYYEPQVAGFVEGDGNPFWIWGIISWLIFFYLLWEANKAFKDGRMSLAEGPRALMGFAWKLLIVTWFIYGFAYLIPGIPGINQSADFVVVRQVIYTVADVVSKTVFGILLARVAMQQSAIEDPRYAQGTPEQALDLPRTADAVVVEKV
ncbi:bacteriorhodopsin [uncultured Algimonas sp.]|uniref:bacteriorhodopsin n=1 Tax=uncultured Algimonas sp. TaxID=1547920 RepID=UPI00261BD8E1|nr:bacteriorhodopsin [uncultured Algimonas sp.]